MLTYFLQTSLCWAFFLLIYKLVLKKETFFANNRWYLLSTLSVGLAFPFVRMLWESWSTTSVIYVLPFQGKAQILEITAGESNKGMTWTILVLWIFWLGFTVALVRFLKDLFSIYLQIRKYPHSRFPNYTLIHTDYQHLPFSFFKFVFISKQLAFKDPELNKILTHEITHVHGWHSLDILAIESIGTLFWWNPLIYWYKKAIRDTHEYIADAQVLKSTDTETYGTLLLNNLQNGLQLALANHFISSQLKNRINMMLQFKSKPVNRWKYLLAIPLLITLVVLFAYRSPIQNIPNPTEMKEIKSHDHLTVDSIPKVVYVFNNQLFGSNPISSFTNSQQESFKVDFFNDKETLLKYREKTGSAIEQVVVIRRKRFEDIPVWVKNTNTLEPDNLFKINDNYPYIYNGKILSYDKARSLILNAGTIIESVSKEEVYKRHKLDVEYGAFEISLSSSLDQETDLDPSEINLPISNQLYLLNGQVVPKSTVDKIDPSNISNINILKGNKAVAKYGQQAEFGAIEVYTKIKYFINNQVATKQEADALNPNNIRSMVVEKSNKKEVDLVKIFTSDFKEDHFNADPAREIFKVVEEAPRFPGCEDKSTIDEMKKCADEKMLQFLYKNIQYPQEAKAKNIQGRVVVSFVIEKDGSIADATVVREIGSGCGEEALRVVRMMNHMTDRWIPGKQKGQKVAVQFNLPIQFKLDTEQKVTHTYLQRPVFNEVEEAPRFPGCEGIAKIDDRKKCAEENMFEFLFKNIMYPEEAKKLNIKGKVVLSFIIEADGTISNEKIVTDAGGGCGDAALQAIRIMKSKNIRWIPGKQQGDPVAVEYKLPVMFMFTGESEKTPDQTKEHTLELSKTKLKDKESVQFLVTPNPATQKITIQYQPAKNVDMDIFDLSGRRVFHTSWESFSGIQSIDVSHFLKGTYIVKYKSDGDQKEQKLIIQ